MGWLIDPEEEIIFVYFSDRTIAIFESENALLPVPAFASNFQITLGQLFDWLRG
jgi:Uma2 family endonuclease